MPVPIIDTDQIVITASRAPESEARTAASVTIIDRQLIVRLDEPVISALLRLTPSAAVATSGPAGSLTEIRIRGAEANHTLLFVDGIKIDDPASGDTPRFEILNADLASRIEVVRGPQSALWGSEAVGGVIAVNGVDDVRRPERESRGRFVRPVPDQRLGRGGDQPRQRSPAPWASSARPGSTALPVPATRTAIAISRAGCAAPGTRARMWRSEPRRSALSRPDRVRRLRPVHRRPCRHARQQPQSPRGRADLGDHRQRCVALARAGRRHAARLVEQELSRRRAAEPHARRSPQSVGSDRTAVHDRRRDPSPDRRR